MEKGEARFLATRTSLRNNSLLMGGGLALFHQEMRIGIGFGEDAQAEDVGDDRGGITAAVHAKIGELVRGQALGVECAEAGFVAEERAAGHGHTAREKGFDGSVQPDDRNALGFEEFGSAVLRISAAAESENGRFAEFDRAAESGAELGGFEQAEGGFAVAIEEFGDARAGGVFDEIVEINEAPGELAGELRADGGFAGAHEACKGDDGGGGSAGHEGILVERERKVEMEGCKSLKVQEFKS